MPIIALNNWTQNYATPSEQGFLGLTMMFVGVSIVFLVLVLIFVSLEIMGRIINRNNKSDGKSDKNKRISKNDKTEEAPVSQAVTKEDDSIIAAISACIQILLQKEGSDGRIAGFRIRKIRRV